MTTTRLLARRTIRAPHRALVSTLVVIIAVTAAGAARAEDGRDLYQAACAACHASDGRGHPVDRVGFEVPLPDFTDCAFSTAEADADWLAVAHAGGPVRAFDRRMPAFGEALSEAELRGILRHIRSFCTDAAWPRGELNLPRALITEKAFPENEAVITTSVDSGDPGAVGYELLYERRLGSRTQLELMVPLDLQQAPSGDWEGGVGDVALAVKRVLFHSLPRGAIFSAALELVLPTGREERGIGSGVTRVEPFVAYGQILPRDAFVQVQTGLELSTDTAKAGHEAFWRAAAGRTFAQAGGVGRAWTPMIEILGARELDQGQGAEWDVVPQLQVSLSRRQHVLVNAGVRIPLNERQARHPVVVAYLLWDWFDGGFFTGWR